MALMGTYTDVCSVLKPAKRGSAEIRIDTPSGFERLSGALHGQPLDREKYARLLINGRVMMTDAEFERLTNLEFVCKAHGDILIAGLGIGMILKPALKNGESVTVVEINPDVIALVAPSFDDPKLRIVSGDIDSWLPEAGQRFDAIYFDIWEHFNEETNAHATKLGRRFCKYLKPGGWMGSWTRAAWKATNRR